MKIYEIIIEHTLNESIPGIPTRKGKAILTALGFEFDRKGKGTHEIWVNEKTKESFTISFQYGMKEFSSGPSQELKKMMRDRKFNPALLEKSIDEAMGLPGDASTLLSLLSEMVNMLGAGGPNHDQGPLRSAVMQVFNNGSADDAEAFGKQLNFRLGSVRSMWMSKNWPQLKSCFLRLKKNPKYQRAIASLNELGDWPVFLIKDKDNPPPTLSKYFNTILSVSPTILKDMARFESEEHVKDRAMRMAQLIPERLVAFGRFISYWTDQYEKDTSPAPAPKQPKDNLAGQQAAGAQSIVDQVLNAIPKDLAKELRPQIARMGSQNEKMMFLMKSLQKAGIDPNKVLG